MITWYMGGTLKELQMYAYVWLELGALTNFSN